MRIFGLRWKRYVEWREVLIEERKTASLLGLLAKMLWVAIKGLPHLKENRRTWRAKMRVCPKCPIFDKGLHRCKPWTGSPLGCGCSVIFKAVFSKKCYADEVIPDMHYGWVTHSHEITTPRNDNP